jgi:hypothetical protein
MLLSALIFFSPFLQFSNFLFSKIITILFYSIIVVYILERNIKLNYACLSLICLYFLFAWFPTIYYKSLNVIYNPIKFVIIFIPFLFYDKKYLSPFVDISTVFIILLLIGAYIGFIYGMSGGKPVFIFKNPDGRSNSLYLTTCTNTVYLNKYIRPAGIYDEPGALSFFVCSIAIMRVFARKNDFITFLMLIFGLITFSLTHVFVLALYAIYYFSKYKKKKFSIVYIILISSVMILIYKNFQDAFDQVLFSRFTKGSGSRIIAGDNRSGTFKNALELLDMESFFWGISDLAYSDANAFYSQYRIGSNPLTPLASEGIFLGWIYYFFILLLLIAGLLKRRSFCIFISIIVLFLQRPNVTSVSYSFYFIWFLLYAIHSVKENIDKIVLIGQLNPKRY